MSWMPTLLASTAGVWAIAALHAAGEPRPNTGMADPAALVRAFDRFAAGDAAANVLTLSLSNLRGISSERQNAGGNVRIDLATGAITSALQLMPTADTDRFDLWLVDNQPEDGHTTLADAEDHLLKVGMYALVSGRHRLSLTLDPAVFTSFYPDRAFVVRLDRSPVYEFVLTGSSTFFARLRRRQVRFVDDARTPLGFDLRDQGARAVDFARLVAQGRRVFLNETFAGNGRTCGTCHVETNNFTIDPELITGLPASDPLFVAETNPALSTLENPELMRRFGLIGIQQSDGRRSGRHRRPFFHNHTVANLESAVAFYGTPAFQASIFAAPPIIPVSISADHNDPEVQAIAAFLRVLNALENIRSAVNVAERGRTMTDAGNMRDLARLSLAETIDAIEVLSRGALAKHPEPGVLAAGARLLAARQALDSAQQLHEKTAVDRLLIVALRDLRAARSSLVDPATLPPSFRN